jgi:hypothetical protein
LGPENPELHSTNTLTFLPLPVPKLHKQTLPLPANALPWHRSTLSIFAWDDPKRSQALASIVERIIEAEELRTVLGGDARKV